MLTAVRLRRRWRGRIRSGAAILLTIVGLALIPAGSASAEPTKDELKAQERILFKQTILQPNNLDIAFKYSEVATKLGDFEAAIGALERMLFYNRDLPRVKLELGLLYFRLGSYEQARSYFNAALVGQSVPQDVRDRVAIFIRETERRVSANQFSFYAQTGFRYQTNANAGPGNAFIRALGQDAVLDSRFVRRSDVNWFAISSLRHVYDFENQRGDTFETNVSTYYARQFSLSALNLGFVEIDAGPRFGIGDGTGLSIRPYLLGNEVALGDRQYALSGGGGIALSWRTTYVDFAPGIEFRKRDYSNTPDYPMARDQLGQQVIGYISAAGPSVMIDNLRWQSRLSVVDSSAKQAYYAYRQVAFDFSLPYEIEGFAIQKGRKLTVAPFAGFSTTDYERPNALIEPTMKRSDYEYRVGGALDVQLYEAVGFAMQLQYGRIYSNIKNYRTSNFLVSGGPTVRF